MHELKNPDVAFLLLFVSSLHNYYINKEIAEHCVNKLGVSKPNILTCHLFPVIMTSLNLRRDVW